MEIFPFQAWGVGISYVSLEQHWCRTEIHNLCLGFTCDLQSTFKHIPWLSEGPGVGHPTTTTLFPTGDTPSADTGA